MSNSRDTKPTAKHTDTPWKQVKTIKECGDTITFIQAQGVAFDVRTPPVVSLDDHKRFVERIIECAHACEGMEDPAKVITDLKEALNKCRCAITGYKSTNPLHPDSVLHKALDAAKSALANAGVKTGGSNE